ncbi:glycoside hydrolase family 108 protein [Qipengyuania sp. NPDC077410]|uniref:glycoside hydrolase family 108 protein n=1 Tax=Qipengyuania sp. NPDC077410 TaxID=3364496 RepID=UPI0037C9075F
MIAGIVTVSDRRIKTGALGIGGAIALIVASVFAVEGGYVNDPRDPGGETNHGITKRTAEANGYRGDMRTLTKDRAREIYVSEYIQRPGYVPLVERDLRVAEETIDSGVNAGTGRSSKWFQECLNAFNNGGRDYQDVAIDGQIGPASLRAFDALRARRGAELAGTLMVRCQDSLQAGHYLALANANSKFQAFTVGWFRTRIRNVQ